MARSDLEWMKEAWRLTRKDDAPGIDGMTAVDYAKNLEANLLDLLGRIKSGRYQAPPEQCPPLPTSRARLTPAGDRAKTTMQLLLCWPLKDSGCFDLNLGGLDAARVRWTA
jgi:hypothetical protein